MEKARIAELLSPFVSGLDDARLAQLSSYLDLLLRWNARMNLTAVRNPEQMVTRHFGESLFAATRLVAQDSKGSLIDVGSGAGFPGIPIKISAPGMAVRLIESRLRKAMFLREVVRTLRLEKAEVFLGRAESCEAKGDVVTLRAVEQFESVLPVAARLLAPQGRLALLIGAAQVKSAREILPQMKWQDPVAVPQSSARVLLVGIN